MHRLLSSLQRRNIFRQDLDPVACFSDEDDVSGNQNNCYWPLHNGSIARCKHHMQEKLVYCWYIGMIGFTLCTRDKSNSR